MVVQTMTERRKRVQEFSTRELSALLNALDGLVGELNATRELMSSRKMSAVEFDGPGRAARAINMLSDFSADLEAAVKKHGKRV
jgi:hypothetical protein